MEIKDNIIYFDNDKDFYDSCVSPNVVVYQNKDNTVYFDIDFTSFYKNAIKSDKKFIIKDEDSVIYKHNGVHLRSCFKEIENLEPYIKKKSKE